MSSTSGLTTAEELGRLPGDGTRRWWAEEGPNCDLVISAFVVGELQDGEFPGRTNALALIGSLPLLGVVPEVAGIVQTYIARTGSGTNHTSLLRSRARLLGTPIMAGSLPSNSSEIQPLKPALWKISATRA